MSIKKESIIKESLFGDIRLMAAKSPSYDYKEEYPSFVNKHVGHLNGYCEFPKKPVRENDYSGILSYVPVHGGITYANAEEGGKMVYGFDTVHAGDDEGHPEFKDPDWILEEAKRMAIAIQTCAKYEYRYLRCITNKGKAKVIDSWREELKEKYNIE